MSQFPQTNFPQQPYQQPPMQPMGAPMGAPMQAPAQQPYQQPPMGQQFAPQGYQPGPAPQQQFQQPQQGYGGQAQMPQLPKVPYGQGYQPGQFPHENTITVVGQIFPNKWMPNGIEFKPGDKPQIHVNLKVRNAWGTQPNQVKIQFLRLVAFGQAAQQIASGFKAGQIVRVVGEFRPNRYKPKNGGEMKQINQIILDGRNGQNPIQLLGELPMYDEFDPTNYGGNQQSQPQQYQQPAPQQYQQPAPQGYAPPPMQAAPMQPPPMQQQQSQQYAPPPAQFPPQYQQPQGLPPQQYQQPPQQVHPGAGMPQQPGPGQQVGNFAPPQGAPPQGGAPAGFPGSPPPY